MGFKIIDGEGSGKEAGVDYCNRVKAKATTISGAVSAQQKGDAYFLSSGLVTLTSGNESGVLYIKTNETSVVVIDSIQIQLGLSDGTGDVIRGDYVAVSGGTLLTDQDPGIAVNVNAGSSKSLDTDVYKGKEGATITGISTGQNIYQAGTTYEETTGGFIVPKGSDLAVSITPPAGNTSMNVVFSVFVHLLDSE